MSIDRSYGVRFRDSKTSRSVRCLPSRYITTSCGVTTSQCDSIRRAALNIYIRATLHLALDEAEHMFLVHACRMVHMGVDLSICPYELIAHACRQRGDLPCGHYKSRDVRLADRTLHSEQLIEPQNTKHADLHFGDLSVFVQQHVQIPFALQIAQAPPSKTFSRP